MPVAASLVAVLAALGTVSGLAQQELADWTEYTHDRAGSGYAAEDVISPSNAASLAPMAGWDLTLPNDAICPSPLDTCSSAIAAQPVIATVSGAVLMYLGSWNGSEYAICAARSCTVGATSYSAGQIVWRRYLGRTAGCKGPYHSNVNGITSTAAVARVTIGGTVRTVVYVGGGGNISRDGTVFPGRARLFALDALDGSVVWQQPLGNAPSHYTWSSPRVANGSVYIGIASLGDCPLVQGKLFQFSPEGQLQHSFSVVPAGCLGGGVWGTPSIDPAGNLYVPTGNAGACFQAEPLAVSILRLSPSLTLQSHWQIPAAEQIGDGDFGSVPTLFSGTVSLNGQLRQLLGIVNKNGTYYVLDRSNLALGPIKRLKIGLSLVPSAWDGRRIYIAGGRTTINGVVYAGSIRSFDPNNLTSPIWQRGLGNTPLAAVSASPGLVVFGVGSRTVVLFSATGNRAFFKEASGRFFGAPTISHGVIWEGDTSGVVHAYSVNGA